MNLHRPSPVRLSAALIAAAAFAPSSLHAHPGALIPGQGSTIEKPGDVLAASITEDGSVMLAGLFSRVNTTPAPGIARLKDSGAPDTTFTSGVGIGAPVTVPPPGSAASITVACPIFQNLPGGEVMVGDPPMGMGRPAFANVPLWFVIADDGNVNLNPLTSLAPEEPVMPQFVQDGKLIALVSSANTQGQWQTKVRRLRLDTGTDDPGFSAALTGTPSQVLPAASGGLWVLERSAGEQRILQLKSSGEPAAAFAPVNLATASTALQTMPAGALAVSSSQFAWSDAAADWNWIHRTQFFTAAGEPGTPRVQTGGTAPFYIEPDGALLREFSPPSNVNPLLSTVRTRLLSRELPNGQADPAFTSLTTHRFLHRLSDGRLLTDGTRRFLPNGTPDPSWTAPAVMTHGAVRALYPAPGGAVIGIGDFTMMDGQPRPGITRWRADGTLDAGFVPSAAEGAVTDCAVATDGSLTILRGGSLQRLHPNGSPDPSFTLTIFPPSLFPLDQWEEIEPLPGGEVLALTVGGLARISVQGACTFLIEPGIRPAARGLMALPDGRFFHAARRWLPDCTQDPTFLPPSNIGSVPLCAAGPDKWLFHRGSGLPHRIPAVLLNDDGSLTDPSLTQSIPAGLTAAASGSAHAIYTAEGSTILRRYPDGRRDVSFRAPRLERRNESIPDGMPLLSAAQNGGTATVTSLLIHPLTNQLWLAGNFSRAGESVRTGLAFLDTSTPAGYAAWSLAVFENQTIAAIDADPDADGLSNFQEYAAGTDPLLADAAAALPVILTTFPFIVSAPQNPFATEVSLTLEISTGLTAWYPAPPAEAVRKTVNGLAAFELAPAPGQRFVRIRYRSQP